MKKNYLLKTMMLLCMLMVGMGAWAEEWSHTFAKGNAVTDNAMTISEVTWGVSTTVGKGSPTITFGNAYSNYCIKFGSGANNCYSNVTLSTDYFKNNGYKVTGVSLNVLASAAKTMTFKVGGTSKTHDVKADSWSTVSIESLNETGQLTIAITPNSAAVNINNITVTYEKDANAKTPAGIAYSTTSYTYNLAEGANGFTTPTLTNPNSLTASYSSSNTSVASVNATTGVVTINGVGTATITATTAENATYYSGSASYSIRVISLVGNGTRNYPYTVEDVKSLGAIDQNAWVIGTICGTASSATKLQTTDVNSNLALGTGESFFIPIELPSGNARSVLNIKDNTELNGKEIKIYGNITSYYSTTGVKGVSNYEAPYTITLNDACHDEEGYVYGTYSNVSSWIFPDDIVVSVITVDGENLYTWDFENGDVVPGATGVLVSAMEGGDYTITVIGDAGVDPLEGVYENALRASGKSGLTAAAMSSKDPGKEYFRLTMHNGTDCGFWWGAAEGAAFDLGANKAYLVADAASLAKGFRLGGDANAIKNVTNDVENNVVYNLNGQRVNANVKGIVIVNGKKMLNK